MQLRSFCSIDKFIGFWLCLFLLLFLLFLSRCINHCKYYKIPRILQWRFGSQIKACVINVSVFTVKQLDIDIFPKLSCLSHFTILMSCISTYACIFKQSIMASKTIKYTNLHCFNSRVPYFIVTTLDHEYSLQ